jgi:hypothetical protein
MHTNNLLFQKGHDSREIHVSLEFQPKVITIIRNEETRL